MTSDASDKFSDLDRRTIHILASSTNGCSKKDAVSDHLKRAVEAGSSSELEKAGAIFKELPVSDRQAIKEKSITQATNSTAMRRILLGDAEAEPEEKAEDQEANSNIDWKPLRR